MSAHTQQHDDVTRITLTWWRSAVLGYDVSVYLVDGVLIDTGFPGAAADVASLLAERRPRAVVVTHQHEDHAGNAELVPRSGIPLLMAASTRDALRSQPAMGAYRRFAWGSWRRPESAAAAAAIGEPIDALELVPTPGHSPDHHVVWDARTRTLFGGDLFLGVKVKVARPGENPRQLARSLRRAIALGPGRYFDAHRGLVPDPVGALAAKADWLEETIGLIDALANRGFPRDVIRDEILGREPPATLITAGDLSKFNFVNAVLVNRD